MVAVLLIASLPIGAQPSADQPSGAQPIPEAPGVPFLTSWDYLDYGAHSQNWAIVQDPRGVMYFGNSNGVLQFDGSTWRILFVSNGSIVRSLAVDRLGTVYVGAVGELGFLRSDETGNLGYVSLLDELDASDRELNDVWRTWATDEGVFFWTIGKLLRWHKGRFDTWPLDSKRGPFWVGGKLYNNQPGVGLVVLGDDDAFHPVAGGEVFADVGVILLPHGDDGMLAGSRDGVLWVLSWIDGDADGRALQVKRFATAAGDILAQHKLYSGVRLPAGGYAFGTMTGGSVVIDAGGGLVHRFTRGEGLLDESVWSLFVDRDGGLWHALNRGLARFELGTPITRFDQTAGLDGTVEALCRSGDSLYVATSLGLYRMRPPGGKLEAHLGGRIEALASRGAPFWSLLAGDRLGLPGVPAGGLPGVAAGGLPGVLVGGTDGVYQLRDRELAEVTTTHNAFVLYPSSSRPGVVFFGDMSGTGVLEFRNGRWVDAGRLEGVDKEIRSIAEDGTGRLWLGTRYDSVLRVTLAPGREVRVGSVKAFGADEGFASHRIKNLKVLSHDDGVLFASTAGLFRFDPDAETFAPSTMLGEGFGLDLDSVLRWSPDRQGNVWLSLLGGSQVIAVRGPGGSYTLDRDRLIRLFDHSVHAILPEPGVTWLGGVQGLFRFDRTSPAAGPGRETPFEPLIRRVTVALPGGKMLFGGDRVPDRTPWVLPYAESSLRFEYAMPRFDGIEDNRYRSRLVGLEEVWSDWTDEIYRDFTALREGGYGFEVQGRDTYQRSSEIATFNFRVLPPWYRSWWAYALYAAAFALAAWSVLAWLLRRARLGMEVERLAEANAMMRRTERERQQFVSELEAKNSEMERFIYTVSHDLKSPLISIRGFLGMLEQDIAAGKQDRMRHDMERIHAATGKMGHLVEELLELSKIGRQAHEPETVAMDELAREAADQVAGLIAERRVEVVISPDLPPAKGDRQRLLAMLQNLIENGVKYMGDQPSPRIEIDHRPHGDETVYRVRDNGIGIDPRYQERIFGLFERLSTEAEGTGVGLALVKRIVAVHGGSIWAESEGEGKGSTFCFTLP